MSEKQEEKIARQTMTSKEAADFLGISYWLLCDLVKKKQIPHIRTREKGGRILFRLETLNEWLDSNEKESIIANENVNNLNNADSYGMLRKAQG